MGGGKGKIKTLNAKRTTYFLKHAKMKNRPAENKMNSLFYKINRYRCKTNDH